MKKRVNKPKRTCRVSKWPALALLLLLNGFAVLGYCLDVSPSGDKPVQKAQAIWLSTGNLNTARYAHTATLLPNGKVLVVGGTGSADFDDSAELYEPETGNWSVTGRLNAGRAGHTATLLPNGQVLVVGGVDNSFGGAELYDPSTGTWTRTSNPAENRFDRTATLLQTGKVLVAGGNSSSAELYDPATRTWSRTGRLLTPRLFLHQATLLRDGRVLVTGGANDADLVFPLSAAELYDPVTGTWSPASGLITPRDEHTSTLLPSGNVLVAGGYGPPTEVPAGCASQPISCGISPTPTNSAELFDSATTQWRNTGALNTARAGHTATLLPDNTVLVVGGFNLKKTTELYDAASGAWANASDLFAGRWGHTATLLPNGKVLVAGGTNAGGALNSAELYQQPSNNSFRMTALFSDQAGLYQYIQLQELSGQDNQDHFSGLTLAVTSRKGVVKTFTFPNDLPSSSTARRSVLIGTTHLGPPTAVDFALPPQFIPTDGGRLVFAGVDVWDYPALAADGRTTLLRGGGVSVNGCVPGFIFQPFTPGFPTGLGVYIDPTIEYYNQSLDHYFITSSQPDIDALDSRRTPGWERTGESFPAWISILNSCGGEAASPPTLKPVCRIYIPPSDGDSHFFSASVAECNDSKAQHPEFIVETSKAFYASLPDPQTGDCLYDQIPVYRLWNARIDSNHRYTTSTATRDLMLTRGYVAEGYGPNAVALCVGGGIPGSGN